jgi:hypothetical protein
MIQLIDLESLLPAGSNSNQIEQADANGSLPDNQNQQNTGDAKTAEEKVIEPVPQYKGNYKNFNVEKSQIIDRAGNMNQAVQIAKVLGIQKSLVTSEVDLNKQLAATIILGKDYKKLNPFAKD